MPKKVYIVEDFPQNLKLFEAVFNKIADVEIFTETDGLRGLNLIESGSPDLIILDYDLPRINGLEICRKLRKNKKFSDIKIIAVSSSPLEDDTQRKRVFEKAGFDFVLTKPLDVKEFKILIKKLIS